MGVFAPCRQTVTLRIHHLSHTQTPHNDTAQHPQQLHHIPRAATSSTSGSLYSVGGAPLNLCNNTNTRCCTTLSSSCSNLTSCCSTGNSTVGMGTGARPVGTGNSDSRASSMACLTDGGVFVFFCVMDPGVWVLERGTSLVEEGCGTVGCWGCSPIPCTTCCCCCCCCCCCALPLRPSPLGVPNACRATCSASLKLV